MLRAMASAALLGSIAGCALPVQVEMESASEVAHYATRYDHVVGADTNLLDHSLAECSEKTAKAETICVRQGIDGAHLPPRALIALVPNCRAGRVCRYDHTTHDRLGFVRASATDYVKHWRIVLDFRHPVADVARLPVTVIDSDDFDSAPPAAVRGG